MSKHSKSPYLSDLKRVRGLGTAHSGVHHFWLQRVTALAMIPLTVWFLYSILSTFLDADRINVASWFTHPLNAVLMAILAGAMFIHSRLGIQTIIEDYVHNEAAKITLLVISSAAHIFLGLATLVAITHLHFNGI